MSLPRDSRPKDMARKLTPKDLERFRDLLLRVRGVLVGDIDDLEQDAFGINGEKAAVDNLADGGSDSFYQEFSLELLARDEHTLAEIDSALERIDSGQYGVCESCETAIHRERLRAVPHTRNCITCQRAAEQSA